jgi:hypothetical protein
VYVLVGLPGVGKYTVAASLERRLAAHEQVVRLVDNHYTCNPVFGLVAEDGITPLSSAVWDRVGEVREVVAQTIETISPAEWSFIHSGDRPAWR